MYRTNNCGELRISDTGREVTLAGWVQHIRDFGNITFITLRDRYGLTQLYFNPESAPGPAAIAKTLGREFVIQAKGKVVERSSPNKSMPTGLIEIAVEELKILNPSLVPPFTIEDQTDGSEEQRMKYRYLDLRRKPLKNNIILRHEVLQETRKYLSEQGFLEIETPFLVKSTPEGARDFVVPSRMHEGQFYALPQSPQTFKQLLMMAGFDKYFQVVKCFRDEDLRADRQPEFTQIDCEMSFVEVDDVIHAFTGMMRHLFTAIKNVDLGEIPRMPYDEALKYYGSDKPDLRFGMKICYLKESIESADFEPFRAAISKEEGKIAAIVARGASGFSRRQVDEVTEFVKEPHRGLKGLVWIKWNQDDTISSSAGKFFSDQQLRAMLAEGDAKKGDLMLIGAGPGKIVERALGELRLHIADMLGLRDKDAFSALWVVDFPMFEWNDEHKQWSYMHHPFTSPRKEDLDKLLTDPAHVKAYAYDFVINGTEVGGGSIRIHDRDIQNKVFQALGLNEEEIREKFGFLLQALEYGAPPHAGIAFGFDRLNALMAGTTSIREVMAFPKNNAGRDIMMDAPSVISEQQMKELRITIDR